MPIIYHTVKVSLAGQRMRRVPVLVASHSERKEGSRKGNREKARERKRVTEADLKAPCLLYYT